MSDQKKIEYKINEFGTISTFPVDRLPIILRQACEAISAYSGLPIRAFSHFPLALGCAAPGASIVGVNAVTGGIFGPHVSALLGSRISGGKSRMMEAAAKPFVEVEALLVRQYWDELAPKIKRETADLKEKLKVRRNKKGNVIDPLTDEEKEKIYHRLDLLAAVKSERILHCMLPTTGYVREAIANNIAYAKLCNPKSAEHANAICVINDEGVRLFSDWADTGNGSAGTNDPSFYQSLWSTMPTKRETVENRRSGGQPYIGKRPVGSLIACAPTEIFYKLYKCKELAQYGFLARALGVEYFGPLPKIDRSVGIDVCKIKPYYDAIYKLMRARDEAEVCEITMPEWGNNRLQVFAHEVVDLSETVLKSLGGVPGRWAENAERIALGFHLFEHGGDYHAAAQAEISDETVDAAILYMRFLANEQLKIYEVASKNSLSTKDACCLEGLEKVAGQRDKTDGATAREMVPYCAREFDSRQQILEALWDLCVKDQVFFWHGVRGGTQTSRFWPKRLHKQHAAFCAKMDAADSQSTHRLDPPEIVLRAIERAKAAAEDDDPDPTDPAPKPPKKQEHVAPKRVSPPAPVAAAVPDPALFQDRVEHPPRVSRPVPPLPPVDPAIVSQPNTMTRNFFSRRPQEPVVDRNPDRLF